jgi:hypothetical protein
MMQVMLDTVGPELQVVNKSEVTISLEENESVVLTPHKGQEASSKLLPINFSGLAKVKPLILSPVNLALSASTCVAVAACRSQFLLIFTHSLM